MISYKWGRCFLFFSPEPYNAACPLLTGPVLMRYVFAVRSTRKLRFMLEPPWRVWGVMAKIAAAFFIYPSIATYEARSSKFARE